MDVIRRKFDGNCSDVLFQALRLPCSRNRNYPRHSGKQPSERYLSECRLLLFRDLTKQINQGLIRFQGLRRKAREGVAEVGTVELYVFVDLSREEAPAKRGVWNEADPELLKCRHHFCFGVSRP
jgi:hypothetical protein